MIKHEKPVLQKIHNTVVVINGNRYVPEELFIAANKSHLEMGVSYQNMIKQVNKFREDLQECRKSLRIR